MDGRHAGNENVVKITRGLGYQLMAPTSQRVTMDATVVFVRMGHGLKGVVPILNDVTSGPQNCDSILLFTHLHAIIDRIIRTKVSHCVTRHTLKRDKL
jgi:hypothetical protein